MPRSTHTRASGGSENATTREKEREREKFAFIIWFFRSVKWINIVGWSVESKKDEAKKRKQKWLFTFYSRQKKRNSKKGKKKDGKITTRFNKSWHFRFLKRRALTFLYHRRHEDKNTFYFVNGKSRIMCGMEVFLMGVLCFLGSLVTDCDGNFERNNENVFEINQS